MSDKFTPLELEDIVTRLITSQNKGPETNSSIKKISNYLQQEDVKETLRMQKEAVGQHKKFQDIVNRNDDDPPHMF